MSLSHSLSLPLMMLLLILLSIASNRLFLLSVSCFFFLVSFHVYFLLTFFVSFLDSFLSVFYFDFFLLFSLKSSNDGQPSGEQEGLRLNPLKGGSSILIFFIFVNLSRLTVGSKLFEVLSLTVVA